MKHFIIPGVLLLFISTANLTAQWVRTFTIPTSVTSFISNGNNLFLAANYVYRSSNNGMNWSNLNQYGRVLGKNDNFIYSGSDYINGGSIFKSSNNGTAWIDCNMPFICFRTLVVNGNYLFAGIQVCGQANFYRFYMSTNNGENWLMQSGLVTAEGKSGNTIFAGGLGLLHRSTDNGLSWEACGLGPLSYKIDGNANFVFAGTNNNGVYKSSDNGISWDQTSFNNQSVPALIVSGNNIFAGTIQNGIYISSDNGLNWVQKSEGLPATEIMSLYIFNNFVYAGTYNYGAYKRPINELIGITQISSEIPISYLLYQNYPNPFNPTTHLRFEISELRLVNLAIYDALGREVTTLVNEQLQPGTYEVEFDASNYPSGLYYYKLIAGVYSVSKKMVFVK